MKYDDIYDNKFYKEDLISLDVELTRKLIEKLWLVPSKQGHLVYDIMFI